MKFLIVFVALFAVALARPNEQDVEILKQVVDVQPESYNYEVDTSDGTSRKESGVVKDAGGEHASISVQGSYSWKDEKDGKIYTVTYVADENGFQPQGEHLPPLPKIDTSAHK